MERVRVDKWLWAARFFKTRALASRACEMGRVGCGEVKVKASREVKVGDLLRVKNEGGEFEIEVMGLSEMRGPAAVAQGLYRETEVSRGLRMKAAEERKVLGVLEGMREGKPSKKDRRELAKLRGGEGSRGERIMRPGYRGRKVDGAFCLTGRWVAK